MTPSATHDLVVRPGAPEADGTFVRVTPESAGWGHVGFEVLALDGTATRETGDREVCVVVVSGECRVGDWALTGREDPWSGPPGAAYLPPGTSVELSGAGEIALCWAPANGGAPARVLRAGEVEHRGRGAHARQVRPILMGDEPADSLLVCEVLTPAGHWSSYPPHKHDRDAMPEESFLEETYYHRVSPARGFALQRVYTDDGELDVSVAASDRDTVLVPRGYHTVSAPPGYELYYLNVMAGPTRAWAIANDPDHEWTM
jgi:5-deoxy-glucuronate isomerase